MANAPQMKIPIGADTSDFDKGAKKVKQEMRDLDKVSTDAFNAIGNALGVDVGRIQQFSSALSGLGRNFSKAGSEGSSALSKVGGAITKVGAGVAGLGLAAAVAAFKQLNAEADAFEATIQGGVIKAQTEAFTSTFSQALRDQREVGSTVASWRQDLKEIWALMKGAVSTGFDMGRLRDATQLAGRAKEIATELYNLDIQRKENSVRVAELEAKIAEMREIISDTTASAADRAEALADAQQLIKDKLQLQLPIAQRQRDLLIEYNKLASSSQKEYDAEIAARIQVNNLLAQQSTEQRSLNRQQAQINNLLREENELRSKRRGENVEAIEAGPMLNNQVTIPVVPIIPPEAKAQLVSDLMDITSQVEDFAVSMVGAFGELFADMATGEDAWGNFANAALSAFGDMAIAVGKIAIETGLASAGIKAAIQLGNPYVAIAAGAALVALGAAVKAGLSNVASGNYSANANVASSNGYSATTSDYEQREVTVNVTGTLEADGDQLVAVINNTNRKSYYGT